MAVSVAVGFCGWMSCGRTFLSPPFSQQCENTEKNNSAISDDFFLQTSPSSQKTPHTITPNYRLHESSAVENANSR